MFVRSFRPIRGHYVFVLYVYAEGPGGMWTAIESAVVLLGWSNISLSNLFAKRIVKDPHMFCCHYKVLP